MALLKDSLVQGSLRVTDELYSDVAYLKTIYAGTSSSDSTPSSGTVGYVLKSGSNGVYWASDSLPASKITSGTFDFDRLPDLYWGNVAVSNSSSETTEPTVQSITAGTMTIGGSSTPDSYTINSNNTLQLKSKSGTSIIFASNGTAQGRFDASGYFRPETTNTSSLGTSSYVWGNLYSKTANITNNVVITTTGYGLTLKDGAGKAYQGIWDNGTNLWIGATSSNGTHHKGATFISTGYADDGITGRTTVYLSIPTNTNGTITHAQKAIAYLNAAVTSGQVLIADGTAGGIKTSGYTIAASVPSGAKFTDTTYTPASSVTAIATTAVVGTSTNYARQDHVHNITLATGDNNGQVKIAGTNVSVKGLGSNAYTSTAYLPLADTLWNTRGTLIPDNTDLNSYNQTDNGLGNYYSPDSSTSGSLDNSPTANSGFRLISLRGYQSTRGHQIALGASATPWIRAENGTAGSYTDWSKILYKTGSSAIGGTSQPVYITTDGKAAAVTSVNVAHGGTGATTAADARTNLLAATGNGRIFYGTCTTPAATAAKVVTCESYDALTVGDVVVVDFSNTNSAAVADLTLNVNNKGAKNIKKHYNSTAANNLNAAGVLTNSIHTFVYDGNYWILIDSDYNSSYSAMSVAEMRTGTATSSRVIRADYLKEFLSTLGGTKLTLSHTSTAITLNHDTSGVTAGTYGSNSTVPVIHVDNTGHITSAVNTTIVAGQVSTNVDDSKLTGLVGFVTNGTVPYRSPYFKVIGSDFYGLQTADTGDSTASEGVKLYLSGTGNISMTGNIKGIASGTIATGTQGWSITNTGVANMTTLALNNSNQTNPTNTLSITSSTAKEGLSIASSASNQGGQIELKTPDSSQGRIVLDFVYSGSTPKFRIIYYNSSGTAKVKELNCSTMVWS